MEKGHKKALLIIVIAALIIGVGISLAYFRATVTRTNQTTRITTGTLSLIFTDNSSVGFAEVIHFGDKRTTTFSIENTGSVNAYASIYWKDIINTYLPGSLVYTLSYGDENTEESNYEVIVNNENVPVSASADDIELLENISIPANTTYNYKLDITLVNSPDVDQTADLTATFYSRFTIKEYKNDYNASKTIATLGITPQESTATNPMFGFASPYNSNQSICTYNGYPVESKTKTAEACQNVYEIVQGEFSYVDESSLNYKLSQKNATIEYVGEAVWDETNGTCTYGGNELNAIYPILNGDSEQRPVKRTGCYDVYDLTIEGEPTTTVTGIKNIGAGTYGVVNQPGGVYSYEDDYGTSYYLRGNVTNNYVKFGKYPADYTRYYLMNVDDLNYPSFDLCKENFDMTDEDAASNCTLDTSLAGSDIYWRIIRINGDGSIRMIYDGTSAHENGDDDYGDRLAINGVAWNISYNDNKYIGYMYGGSNGVTSTSKIQAQTNQTSSNMKNMLEGWYEKVFAGTEYESHISDEIFCNDRSIPTVDGEISRRYSASYSPYNTLGYGSSRTAYGSFIRIAKNENPKLTCTNKNDAFTSTDTKKGNGMLTYPIGLITGDEIRLAGGSSSNNGNYFLAKGGAHWSMSPRYHETIGDNGVAMLNVGQSGELGVSSLYEGPFGIGVAPVINLSASSASQLIGDGTAQNPYRFE